MSATRELQEFIKSHPDNFKNCWFGVECDSGWHQLVLDTVRHCIKLDPWIHFMQIKEKFGGLRIYCSPTKEEILDYLEIIERKSLTICEYCGIDGASVRGNLWLKTLCNECVVILEYDH